MIDPPWALLHEGATLSAILEHKLEQSGTQEWIDELHKLAKANRDEELFRSVARKILDAYEKDPDFQRLMFRAAIENHDLSMLSHEKVGLPITCSCEITLRAARKTRLSQMRSGCGRACAGSFAQLFRHRQPHF